MITGGLLGLFIFATNPKLPPNLPPPDKSSLEKTALGKQAAAKLAEGDRLNISGANDEARLAYYDAVSFYKQAGDHLGQANALLDLGVLEAKLGHNDPATEAIHEALFLYKQESNSLGQANALFQLGGLERMLGRSVQARNDFEQANGLYKLAGDRPRQAIALVAIAMLEAGGDRNDEARKRTQQRSPCSKRTIIALQASVHSALGDLDRKLGHYIPARDSYNEAIELFVKERFRLGQAIALSGLGDLERIFGNYDQARTAYTPTQSLCSRKKITAEERPARFSGLGDLERSRGHDEPARDAYSEALSSIDRSMIASERPIRFLDLVSYSESLATMRRPAQAMIRLSLCSSRSATSKEKPTRNSTSVTCTWHWARTMRPRLLMSTQLPSTSRLMIALDRPMCSSGSAI